MRIVAAIASVLLAFANAPVAAAQVEQLHLLILKSRRQLQLYSGTALIKTYPVGLGSNPVPPKTRQGDRATPEGEYFVCAKNPASSYFMALALSYPNVADAERGLAQGLINKQQYDDVVSSARKIKCPPFQTRLGGEVEIHGMGSSSDWTWGCIALENTAIKELFDKLPLGTAVTIKP